MALLLHLQFTDNMISYRMMYSCLSIKTFTDRFEEIEKLIHSLSFVYFIIFQASALSIKDTYGHINLLINASGILSIPRVLQPGKYAVDDYYHVLCF